MSFATEWQEFNNATLKKLNTCWWPANDMWYVVFIFPLLLSVSENVINLHFFVLFLKVNIEEELSPDC